MKYVAIAVLFIVAFAIILHISWPEERKGITITNYNNSWRTGAESNKFEIENGWFTMRPLLTYAHEGQIYSTYENALGLPIEPKRIENKNILFKEATNEANNYQKIYEKDNNINAVYVAVINGVPYYATENVYSERYDNYRIAYRELSNNETEVSFQINKGAIILDAFLWSFGLTVYMLFFYLMFLKKKETKKN